MPKIYDCEQALPKSFFPAKRINVQDHNDHTLQLEIEEHCIENGQPLVISNFDKKSTWSDHIFSLNKLMDYRGDTDIQRVSGTKAKTFGLGGFLSTVMSTLQTKFNLDRSNHNTELDLEANASFQQQDLASTYTQHSNEAYTQAPSQDLETLDTQSSLEANTDSTKQDLANTSTQQLTEANTQLESQDLENSNTQPVNNNNEKDEIAFDVDEIDGEKYNEYEMLDSSSVNVDLDDGVQYGEYAIPVNNEIGGANKEAGTSNEQIGATQGVSQANTESPELAKSTIQDMVLSDSDDSILSEANSSLFNSGFSENGSSEVDTVTTEPEAVVVEKNEEEAPSPNTIDTMMEEPPDAAPHVSYPYGSKTNEAYTSSQIKGVYAKDIVCPEEYRTAMNDFIPGYLLPLGDNDLFSLLDNRLQAKNLMCYVGQDDTGTALHRDLCGTMGHNVMTMGSPGAFAEWYVVVNEDRDKLLKVEARDKDGKKTKFSSSVAANGGSFQDTDRSWLFQRQVNAYNSQNPDSKLKVQVIVQRPGDLVIIPSRAYHQVRNVGVSGKIAWNRITPQALEYAFEDQIPLYQLICRPEVYKCKAIVRYSLQNWLDSIRNLNPSETEAINNIPAMKYGREKFIENARKLLDLYLYKVLLPEMLDQDNQDGIAVDVEDDDCSVKCDFCHSDIFYRYYHCAECDDYDLCMNCYALGRSCKHVYGMTMCQGKTPLVAPTDVPQEDEQEVDSLIDIYTKFISHFNRIFNEQMTDESHVLYDQSETTLATICRQMEKERQDQHKNYNTCSKECDLNLVYYANPSLDKRNVGALIDNMNQKNAAAAENTVVAEVAATVPDPSTTKKAVAAKMATAPTTKRAAAAEVAAAGNAAPKKPTKKTATPKKAAATRSTASAKVAARQKVTSQNTTVTTKKTAASAEITVTPKREGTKRKAMDDIEPRISKREKKPTTNDPTYIWGGSLVDRTNNPPSPSPPTTNKPSPPRPAPPLTRGAKRKQEEQNARDDANKKLKK